MKRQIKPTNRKSFLPYFYTLPIFPFFRCIFCAIYFPPSFPTNSLYQPTENEPPKKKTRVKTRPSNTDNSDEFLPTYTTTDCNELHAAYRYATTKPAFFCYVPPHIPHRYYSENFYIHCRRTANNKLFAGPYANFEETTRAFLIN